MEKKEYIAAIKNFIDLVQKSDNMEMIKRALDFQTKAMELAEENRELKEKISLLEEQLALSKKMSYRFPFYYIEGDEIPHCPRCWEVDKKAVHFAEAFNSASGPRYDCLECKQTIIHPRRTMHDA